MEYIITGFCLLPRVAASLTLLWAPLRKPGASTRLWFRVLPWSAAQGLLSIAVLMVTFVLPASPVFSSGHCVPHQFASFDLL